MRAVRQPLRQEAATVQGQAILSMVQRTVEADRLATTLLIRHQATDLLEILGLS